MNLDVNYRVRANPTLPTMTVLPQTPSINPACGVSGDSSDDRGARCAHVNRRDILLSQQSRHDLDLQFRFGRPSPHHGDRAQLEGDHVRPQDRDIGDLAALPRRERPENHHGGAHGTQTRWVLNGIDQWHALGRRVHLGIGDPL